MCKLKSDCLACCHISHEQLLFLCVSSKVTVCHAVTCHISHVTCDMSNAYVDPFETKIRIHGNLAHDSAPPGKIRIVDKPCQLVYVGSTISPTSRFSSHKSQCNSMTSKSSGLAKHFIDGRCPNDPGREKENLVFTLVDHLDTTQDELETAGHVGGTKCKCRICGKLKTLEDKFILKTGSFYNHGLNTRDEIRQKSRCQW